MTDTPVYAVTVEGIAPVPVTDDDMDRLQGGFTAVVGMSYREDIRRVRCYFNLPAASGEDAARLGGQMINGTFRDILGAPLTESTATAELAPTEEQAERIVSRLLGP